MLFDMPRAILPQRGSSASDSKVSTAMEASSGVGATRGGEGPSKRTIAAAPIAAPPANVARRQRRAAAMPLRGSPFTDPAAPGARSTR